MPLDSISYKAYYANELEQVVNLKNQQKLKPYNPTLQFEIARIYGEMNCQDSSYATYYKLYKFQKENGTLNPKDYKKLLFKLHKTESAKQHYQKDRRFFLGELANETKENEDDEWKAKIHHEYFKDYFLDSTKYELAQKEIGIVKSTNYYNSNQAFKSGLLLCYGYLQIRRKSHQDAENILLEALTNAETSKDTINRIYCYINLAVNENYRANYKKALYYIRKAEQIKNSKFRIKIDRVLAMNRANAFYGLKDTINLNQEDLRIQKLDSLVDEFKQNSNFYEIDVAYQTKEKDKKIKELTGFKETFYKNRIVYSILLFLVFLLALYSFVRWKKTDRKNRLLDLENEKLNAAHSKTKTELETVKSLVINDYIILKNKSKVYLEELIYVKSDGHYLNLYTTSKKEFVRGKISEIEQELPPNFKKCQRSYIVNENYIKQYSSTEVFMTNGDVIPLSRGFKF